MLRYLSWNLVGSHRMLIRLLPEPKVKSSKGEREGDTKPHADQDEHGCEGNGSRGVHSPDEEVEEEPGTKYNSREKRGCLEIEKNEEEKCEELQYNDNKKNSVPEWQPFSNYCPSVF